MKISLNWLQDFVTLRVKDPAQIAHRVTTGVAEVDEVEIQGGLLKHCCVGKVLTVGKHPGADRLSVCDVQTDDGVKKIVCGGNNLRVGMRVAFAHTGATVRWHGTEMMTLEKTKIRGVESEGMICASAELDLTSRFPASSDHEIIDLGTGDDGVGQPLKEYLGLDDVVLHIDNHAITHRADLFSHIGFAREFVALGLATWKTSRGREVQTSRPLDLKTSKIRFPKQKMAIKHVVDCKPLVPRYVSCTLSITGLGQTPDWMRTRLEATGWRCVSLPVDITNYVAMETGMPLHSFDAGDIRGTVHMRTSARGEKITTLDNVVRELPEGALVLSDDAGVFDLMGIMGGLRSSTKESTKTIYLHAAIVDPVSIRKAVIATGHRTDASTVYEKGVPREAAMRGLMRAVELFLELVPGAALTSALEEWGDEGKGKPITLPLERVSSMLGVEVPEKKIVTILESLEFTAKKGPKQSLIVTPPLHRLGDIRGAHDLIEEVGRVVGYNEIEAAMPIAAVTMPKRDMRTHAMRDALVTHGFTELVPLSLLGEQLLKRAKLDPAQALEIRNPIGAELALMQTSTLPGILENAQRNVQHVTKSLRTFSIARVFAKHIPEHMELGVLLANVAAVPKERALLETPFLGLKADLHDAFAKLGYELDIAVAGSLPASAHPGRYAELLIRALPKPGTVDASHPLIPVGRLFELHPDVITSFDLPARSAFACVDWTAVLTVAPAVKVPTNTPQFPSVIYDETLPGQTMLQQTGDLLRRLRGSHAFLESVTTQDIFSPGDTQSFNLTLRFTYRAPDRTLTEEEARKIHESVLEGTRN